MKRGRKRVLPDSLIPAVVAMWNSGSSSDEISQFLRDTHQVFVEQATIKDSIKRLRREGFKCVERKKGWNLKKEAGEKYYQNRAALKAGLALKSSCR